MNDILVLNGEIQFSNGDFKISDSGNQEIDHILQANKGVFKQSPLVGVGMTQFLNGNTSRNEIKKAIDIGLQFDGFTIEEITFDNGIIDVIATK